MSHVECGVQEFEDSPVVGLGTHDVKVVLGFPKFNLKLHPGQK
jgi:hypothetical protein